MNSILKYLFSQTGEIVDGGSSQPPAGQPPSQPSSDWREPFKADPELGPALEKRTERDLPTFIKSSIALERKLGTSIVPPSQRATPEEIVAFKQKVYGTGIFKAPPSAPDQYEVVRPESVPEVMWDKELESNFRSLAHRHGLSNEAVKEILDLEMNRFSNMKAALDINTKDTEAEVSKWASEKGLSYKQAEVYAGTWLARHATPEQIDALNASGLGNHPALIQLIAQASMDTGEDISRVEQSTMQGSQNADDIAFLNAIKTNGTEENQKFLAGKLQPEYEAAMKRVHGTGPLQTGPAG